MIRLSRQLAYSLLLAGALLLAHPAFAQGEARLEPWEAQTGHIVHLKGVPESLGDPEITGRVVAPEPSDEDLPILSFRLPQGDIEIMVPLPPAGPDEETTVRLTVPGLTTQQPLDLKILPMAAAPGATVRLARTAVTILDVEADRAGTSSATLITSIDNNDASIPAHLIPTAVSSFVLTRFADRLEVAFEDLANDYAGDPDFDPDIIDRIVAASGLQEKLDERLEFARSLPRVQVAGNFNEDAMEQLLAFMFREAHAQSMVVEDAWEKVDIKTAWSLNHWMEVRQRYSRRTPPPPPPPKMSDQIKGEIKTTAQATAKNLANNIYDKYNRAIDVVGGAQVRGRLNRINKMKALYGKAMGAIGLAKSVVDTGIYFHDRMRIALLPSKLQDVQVEPEPPVIFDEDDKRGVPQRDGFGEIRAFVTAESERFEFTLSDAVKLGTMAIGAWEAAKGPPPSPSTPEAAAKKFRDDLTKPTVKDYGKSLGIFAKELDFQRTKAREYGIRGEIRDAGVLFSVGPFEWRRINITDPQYSYLTFDRGTAPKIEVFHPSPIRWGYHPTEAGTTVIWMSTKQDKFPGAGSTGSAAIRLNQIQVTVTADKEKVKPREEVSLECELEFVRLNYREWLLPDGETIEDQRQITWKAPQLEKNECKRKVQISCEATSRDGVRYDLEPTRSDYALITIKQRGPESVSPELKRLEPGERVSLRAIGSKEPVAWELVEGLGRLSSTSGNQTTYIAPQEATRAIVRAMAQGYPDECLAEATIIVGASDYRYSGWLDADVGSAKPETADAGPLEWMRTRADELAAANRRNAKLLATIFGQSMGFTNPRGADRIEQTFEQVFSRTNVEVTPESQTACLDIPCLGRRETDFRDMSPVDHFWSGSPVTQRIDFHHSNRGNYNTLSGDVWIESKAQLVNRDRNAPVFSIKFEAATGGTLVEDKSATLDGALGNNSGADALHTVAWVVETTEKTRVHAALSVNAAGSATIDASLVTMLVLDDRALQVLPPGASTHVVADPKLASAGDDVASELAGMDAEERAMMEQMLGPDFAANIAGMVQGAQNIVPKSAERVITLPGPPEGHEKLTYYIVAVVSFDLYNEEHVGTPTGLRWRGQGSGEVEARFRKLD